LSASNDAGDQAAYESIVGAKLPGRKLGDAFDVPDAVTFLCRDAARYINGHELVVDGGMSADAG
jgi:NAD(P)-dependent dehydrogenase (short-subunit alcohol dehydrogenase family)